MSISAHSRHWLGFAALMAAFVLSGSPGRGQAAAPAPAAAPTLHHFKRLIFADNLKDLAKLKPSSDAGPIVVQGVTVLETKEFQSFLAPTLGRAITTQSVNQLAKDVAEYVRRHDRVVVNVLMPNQDISGGEFRMAVVIGRYSEIIIKHNRWFSDKLIESKLGVKPGDEIRLSELESAVNWANTNPFRHVELLVNTINKQPGTADLDVAVQEHFPVRVAFTYADSGNDVIGNNQYTGSVQFGNLWGLDHQVSVQYTTTDQLNLYQAENFDYRIPLRWHHFLVFDAAYAVVRPTIFNGLINEVGRNFIGDIHYIIPFTSGSWKFESSSGVDYKRINNNLLAGGEQFFKSATDVFQVTESLSGARPDHLGAWAFAANGNFSPGGFDQEDTDAAYTAAHNGVAEWPSRYVYSTLVLQRRFDLPDGFQAFTKAIGQVSSADLLSSEELTIGGEATARGYNELLFSGDEGLILGEELHGPNILAHIPFLPKNSVPMVTQPLIFLDYARVYYKHDTGGAITLPPLLSTGVGLRANLATNFSLAFDFGWQILDTPEFPQPNHCRGHVKVTFAY